LLKSLFQVLLHPLVKNGFWTAPYRRQVDHAMCDMSSIDNKNQLLKRYLILSHLIVGLIFYWLFAAPFAFTSGLLTYFHLLTPLILLLSGTVASQITQKKIMFTMLSVFITSLLWVFIFVCFSDLENISSFWKTNYLHTLFGNFGFTFYILLICLPALIIGSITQIIFIQLIIYLKKYIHKH
jgi:hypothetical protein